MPTTIELEFWPVIGGRDCGIVAEIIATRAAPGDPHAQDDFFICLVDCQGCSRAQATYWLARNRKAAIDQFYARMDQERKAL